MSFFKRLPFFSVNASLFLNRKMCYFISISETDLMYFWPVCVWTRKGEEEILFLFVKPGTSLLQHLTTYNILY